MEPSQAGAGQASTLDDILTGLTDSQREAVLHSQGPLLVIAGPGAGKTRVIAHRVAYFVRSGQVNPVNILAVTFTQKAALELKDRIQRNLPDLNVETMQVSTIHSFCADLLHRYSAQSTLPHGFRILNDNGQFLLVYSNRKALGLGEIVKGRPKDFFDAVLRTFNLATEELVDPAELESWCEKNCPGENEKEIGLWQERKAIAEAYRQYCAMLKEHSWVDFAFLQRYALDLVQQNLAILAELRARYSFILIDEYQDTNAVQERLFRLLAGDGQHLTAVGDDDQSIYRFRGATVRNLQDFPNHYAGAHVVKLVHNFRSHEPIVGHSQQVIVHNPVRYSKDLLAVRGPGNEVILVYERTAAEEAVAIARLLQRLNRAGRITHYGDVAILLRSVKSYAETYVEALTALGIPCQVLGDATLFQQDEISQLYDLFNFLGASKEWGDRYVRHPLVGLSEATCERLTAHKENLLEINGEEDLKNIGITSTSDIRCLLGLLALKRKVQAQEHTSALSVFYDLLAITGCLGRFERAGEAVRLANLGVFSQLLATWDEHSPSQNFYPLREYLGLLREGGVNAAHAALDDAVQIMTIHQAKGLEFPVVVVGAAMDGRLPSTRRKDPYEIPYQLRASGLPEVDDPHLVDERKLFYVAATRARDLLIIGTADLVNKRGGGPSPFLYEMFGDDLHAAAAFSEERIKDIESRPPGDDHGPRPRYSFTQLAYYLQCPLRYKFAVVYNLAIPWLDPVDFGANVHCSLEAIHQRALMGQHVTPEELPALVEANWLSTPRTPPQQEENYRQTAIRWLGQYLREYGNQLPRTLQAETLFSTSLDRSILLGKVDLVRRSDRNGVEIVDFKTSASGPQEVAQAEMQLSIYALGIERELGLPVARRSAHFLRDGRVVSWAWGEPERAAATGRLTALFQQIEQMEFPPRRSYCAQCQEFRDVCPYASTGEQP